ncbi:MAG: hypothetical protein IIT43_03630 [Clostridia bacterium]|nr:hypothetical protein [Clostridia bacterium]
MFKFDFDDLADNQVDILNALIDRAYADTLHGVLEVDPDAGKEAKAKVKTLFDEMLNNKIDFDKEGLDIWLGCIYREIVQYYENAGTTDENPMTEELSQKWVAAVLENLKTVADIASLDDELKSSYSFDYYQRVVDAFRDCFPKL